MNDDQTARGGRRRPAEKMLSDADVLRAIEIADSCLDEAEQVVWTTAGRAQSSETTDRLEELVHDVWFAKARSGSLRRNVLRIAVRF